MGQSKLKILEPMDNSKDVVRGIPKVYFFFRLFLLHMCSWDTRKEHLLSQIL